MAEKHEEKKNAETFEIALITSCGSYDDILKDAQELYDELREAFMTSSPEKDEVPEKAAEFPAAFSKRTIIVQQSGLPTDPAEAEYQL